MLGVADGLNLSRANDWLRDDTCSGYMTVSRTGSKASANIEESDTLIGDSLLLTSTKLDGRTLTSPTTVLSCPKPYTLG